MRPSQFRPLLLLLAVPLFAAVPPQAITDLTSYNVGEQVKLRLDPAASGMASIRYAGETKTVAAHLVMTGAGYQPLWKIPDGARTGRYLVDFTPAGQPTLTAAASFAVHRQLVKVISVDLDKTFYTAGDAINPRIVVRNLSSRRLNDIQVEFEPYTYPWIAPEPDDPPIWKTVVARSLSLAPGEQKEFHVAKATVAEVEHNQPEALYYSVVIRNTRDPDRIYDLAFALPAFTVPPNIFSPKQYPFLYLYWHPAEVAKSQSYRRFYPPEFVSNAIAFDTGHTMFAAAAPQAAPAALSFTIKPPASSPAWSGAHLQARITDAQGREIQSQRIDGVVTGTHRFTPQPAQAGLYTLHIAVQTNDGATLAGNQLEFAVNRMPKSILIFCAHQDDDTAHPGLIRAAVENGIPVHVVYLTSGDSGGCDRFFMHSCDAARAMDFGELRSEEARASLGHLGVPAENISFLGLPDGGLEQIWFHNQTADNPYLSVLLASDHSPYRGAAIPNLAYSSDAITSAIKDFIARYNPDLILTGHPDERHVDHRANNWFVVRAMQQMLEDGKLSRDTQLLVDVVYGAKAGRHSPYRFEKNTFYVSGEAARLGQEATWYYQSQDGNHEQANIKDFTDLPRMEAYPHFRILDWWDHQGWNASPDK